MIDYDSKITEKKEPTKKDKDIVIAYYKKQGFELYKTEDLKPKLDKLALIQSQTRIVKQYEKQVKKETDYLLNMVKKYTEDEKSEQPDKAIN